MAQAYGLFRTPISQVRAVDENGVAYPEGFLQAKFPRVGTWLTGPDHVVVWPRAYATILKPENNKKKKKDNNGRDDDGAGLPSN